MITRLADFIEASALPDTALVEALEPFARDLMLSDLPPKTKVEAGGKVPRREEWFEIIGLTVGDFQRARAALQSLRSLSGRDR